MDGEAAYYEYATERTSTKGQKYLKMQLIIKFKLTIKDDTVNDIISVLLKLGMMTISHILQTKQG